MKKSIFTRILAALGGLTLCALGLVMLAETFFRLPLTATVGKVLGAHTPLAVLVTLLAAIILCVFGVCCLMMLSGRRAVRHKGYVMQKGENGVIGVSVKSIEGLVQTCVQQYEVVERAEISVVERRDGIVILLNIDEAAGVNIPLAVGTLQKQIKQYVSACTGVEVREVRVMVESSENSAVESPFTVARPVLLTAAVKPAEAIAAPAAEPVYMTEETAEAAPVLEVPAEAIAAEPLAEEASVAEAEPMQEAVPAAAPVQVPVIPVMPDLLEEDDRPLHQRLFGAEDQPVFVPAPPELVIEPAAEEPAEEVVEEAAEETVEPVAEEAEAVAADAVMEVVEAMACDESEDEAAEEEAVPEEAVIEAAEAEEDILLETEETDKPQETAWE